MQQIAGVLKELTLQYTPTNGKLAAYLYIEAPKTGKIIRAVAWDGLAKQINANCKNGSPIKAEGYYKDRSWTDRNGKIQTVREFDIRVLVKEL